jgi:hypothetical protein
MRPHPVSHDVEPLRGVFGRRTWSRFVRAFGVSDIPRLLCRIAYITAWRQHPEFGLD